MKIIYFIMACLMFCASAYGEELNFSWIPSTEDISGYVIVMDSGTNEIAKIEDKTVGTYTYILEDETSCHAFAIKAYSPTLVSDLSDFAIQCPTKLITPKLFKVN